MKPVKLSSYQKMKLRYETKIKELQNDITTLIEDKNIFKVSVVKLKYKARAENEKQMWLGTPTMKIQK